MGDFGWPPGVLSEQLKKSIEKKKVRVDSTPQKDLDSDQKAFKRDLNLNDIFQLHKNGKLSIDNISNTLLPDLAKDNSIAIDIESDGREIYQLGYATTCQTKLFDSSKDGFFTEIKETEATATTKTNWLIGHNIIAWDLPLLREVRNNCFSKMIIWDTLLLSWILSPWEKTHALANKEDAHRADSDARASLDLFWKQINQLPTEYVLKLAGVNGLLKLSHFRS